MAISLKSLAMLFVLLLAYSVKHNDAISWGGDKAWTGKREIHNQQEINDIRVSEHY